MPDDEVGAPTPPSIPEGFDLDLTTGKLVQVAPAPYDDAVRARDMNRVTDQVPFPTQPTPGLPPPEQGVTLADRAPTPVEEAGAEGLEVSEKLLLNKLPNTPVGGETMRRIRSAPATGGGSSEFEIRGKAIPDDPKARQMVQDGAARQMAGELHKLSASYDALTGQAQYLSQLQSEFGEFDEDTTRQLKSLAEQEQAKIDQINNLVAEARTRTVNPAAFYGNAGAGSAFAAGIATAVGAITSKYGGLDENTAGRLIEQAVESNIRAQEMGIAQANFADQMESNLLQQIRATTHSRTQARSVLRAMLYNQAELEFARQTAVARREQIPGTKQTVLGGIQQKAGQALLDFQKERGIEFSVKGKGTVAYQRALRSAMPATPGAKQPRRGGGGSHKARPKTSLETAQDQQAQAQQAAQQRQVLEQIVSNDFGAKTDRQAAAYRHQALVEAATPIMESAFEAQEKLGRSWTSAEAQKFAAENPVIGAAVPNTEMLRTDSYAGETVIDSGERARTFFTNADIERMREKNVKDFLKLKGAAGLTLNLLDRADAMRSRLAEIGPVLGRVLAIGPDGFKMPAAGTRDYQLFQAIAVDLMKSINAMRKQYEGGALHGPGEFKIFREMTAEVTTPDKAVMALMEAFKQAGGPDKAIAAWNVNLNALQGDLERGLTTNGFISNEDQFLDSPDIEKNLNRALTQ